MTELEADLDAWHAPLRRDELSDWHEQVRAACDACGCTFYYAADDPDIVWEPGNAWDDGCSNGACRCHRLPIIGGRRSAATPAP